MAIVTMKKLRVMSVVERREVLLKGLLRLGCVEISEPDSLLSDPEWAGLFQRSESSPVEIETEIADVNMALDALRRYAPMKNGWFTPRSTVSEERFMSGETVETARKRCRRVKAAWSRLSQLQSEEERLWADMTALRPWKALDLPLEQEGTEHTVIRLGVCPGTADTGMLRAELEAADAAAELLEISRDRRQVCYLLICHRADEAAAQEVLQAHGFSAVAFRDHTGTAEEKIRRLEQALSENRAAQEAVKAQMAAEAENREELQVYADRLQTEAAKEQNAGRILRDEKILFFQGWMPAEKEDAVKAFLERNDCAWEAVDPTEEEYPQVPVRLKNNRFTRPLNVVTHMYVLPAYDGVDPNPVMAPFFITFYGLMMADMGYGLLMLLGAWIIRNKMHAKGDLQDFGGLLGLCGISTFIWGGLTGSFFGDFIPQLLKILNPESTFRLPYLFTPLTDTLAILVGSLILGVLQIMTGMVISVVKKCRDGRIMDAVWNEVTWWVILAGAALALAGVGNVAGKPAALLPGILMLVTGSFVNGKGFGKVTGLIGAVYNGVTGYFSDTLSYARLMALMLAGSVIAQVFNTLGAVTGNVVGFVLVSLAGNLLNFVLNLLGCFVHDLRLQCLEFFGRFYKEGGKPFQPLRIKTKYVDVIDGKQEEI